MAFPSHDADTFDFNKLKNKTKLNYY